MTASIVALGEAVAAALNEAAPGTFSEAFAASFEFNPNYSSMDAKTLRVVVTDAGGDIAPVGRNYLGFTDSIALVVLWRVDSGTTGIDNSKVGRCLNLLEELLVYLALRSVAGYSATGKMTRAGGDKGKAHYMAGNLEERLFASSVTIEYQTKIQIRVGGSS